ncbi:hypothetical protein SSX86_014620 [Deinandra increscens subsp. villosa]|uniref:PWWP domain-containing protein n=1 Tax=Deinandra increscens subsp. villosa TaxID=3103831 RepID=A0AAP0D2K5_9ASTR
MEIIKEKMMTNKTFSEGSPISQPIDDYHTILKPSLEESVVVTTTVVETTEVSVVEVVQKDDDIMKNQEGLFGNLVGEDEDEGLKGNCSENGASVVMNVDGSFTSLAAENGSCLKPVFDGETGGLAVEHDENAGGDPMDICSSEGNEKKGDEILESREDVNKNEGNEKKGDEILESREDMNKNEGNEKKGDEILESREDMNKNEGNEKKGDEILESKEDMNKNEGNEKKGDEILESKEDVNKNGEGSVKNKENNDKGLADHEEGQEEEDHSFVVGDFVWGKIKSHPWWPGQIYDPSDASDYAATLKRKGRLLVAYFGDGSFSWCSPSQLKPFIDHFQEMSSQSDSKKFVNAVQKALEDITRLVEAELMCKCQLVNRNEDAGVVNRGIKEEARVPKGNTVKVLMDRVEPVEIVSTLKGYATMEPGTRVIDLELTVLKSCLSAFYTKKGGYLLADYGDPECIEGLEEETGSGMVADSDIIGPSGSRENGGEKVHQRRKKKSVAELLADDDTKTKKRKTTKDGGVKDRKRKVLVVSVAPESDHESGGGIEEETMSPRQRKKSKYLSPPYLSPIGNGNLSVLGSGTGTGSFKEPKTEPEKVSDMDAKQLEDSLKKSSGKKTRRVREGSDSQEQKKTDAAVNVTMVLKKLLRAALDPTSFVEKNLPEIREFVSSFRSSAFKEGTCDQTDEKKDGEGDTSELTFIKQKLEWMSEMVHMCEESEMAADVKASLEEGIQQVLEKVVKMRGK